MGDPFYGNGAGVQRSFNFLSEEDWPLVPYRWRDFRYPRESWVNSRRCRQDGQQVRNAPYGLDVTVFRRN